jgi:hypothetical protein
LEETAVGLIGESKSANEEQYDEIIESLQTIKKDFRNA